MKIISKIIINIYLSIMNTILFVTKKERKSIYDMENDPICVSQTVAIIFLLITLVIFSTSTRDRIKDTKESCYNDLAIIQNNNKLTRQILEKNKEE